MNPVNEYLKPIFTARYSPNETKNYKTLNRKLDLNDIHTIDRIGKNDMVEGGKSISIGFEYSKEDKMNNNLFSLTMANVLRDKKNDDLPLKTTLGDKRSDIVGKLNYNPSKFFDIQYQFSLDNNLEHSNYDFVKTNFNVNNFVTSFEYLTENNVIGHERYLANTTTYKFDENNSVSFKTNRNLKKNFTEYYNLIYEYKNDCLAAAIEYNHSYYSDSELETQNNIYFTIKFLPFGGEISAPISAEGITH